MTTDTARPRVERGEVLRVERLGGLVELTARLPHLAATAQPGQFAQLRCGATNTPLLRRPFSVAWSEDGACSFVFHEVGAGTRLLAGMREGDTLDALGPLGHGFSVDPGSATAVCIAGGVGCAPFPLLISALLQRGVQDIIVLNGAATAEQLYPAARFGRDHAGAVEVQEATDDGSVGHRGRVTDLADPALCASAAVYACGPNAMLGALARRLAGVAPPLFEASLEASMGCGFGTCLGCALPVRRRSGETGWALCCTDGPVMPVGDVDWAALQALPGADAA